MDADTTASQGEKKSKKIMDAPSFKAAPTLQGPLSTLVSPRATGAMAHVSRKETPKKQQPSSTVEWLRELSETDDDKDDLVFRKHKEKLHPFWMRPLHLKWRRWNQHHIMTSSTVS